MNANKYVKLIASAILATAAPGLAATADITGHNQWAQDGGAYGGTVTTINATSAQHASGNASLVFDVADGTGNVSATLENYEPTCVYPETTNTVWFKWTCAASGSLMVSTTGSTNTGGTEWDACLGIYTGASLATLTQLASQDSGLDETLSFAVTAGTTY